MTDVQAVATLPIGACHVEVVPGEPRTVLFVNLLSETSTSASDWSASIDSTAAVVACAAAGSSLAVTFDATDTLNGVGRTWSLRLDDLTVVGGRLLEAQPTAAPSPLSVAVSVPDAGEIEVAVIVSGVAGERVGGLTVEQTGTEIDIAAAFEATPVASYTGVIDTVPPSTVDVVLPDPATSPRLIVAIFGGGDPLEDVSAFTFTCASGLVVELGEADLTEVSAVFDCMPGETAWLVSAVGAGGGGGSFQPLDSDLTTIAGLAPVDDDLLQRKAGAWINRTPAQVKTDLALVKGDVGLGNVTNDAQVTKAVVTTKGDIIVATGSATPARVGVGADGKVLAANANESAGVAWVTPAVTHFFETGTTTALAPYISSPLSMVHERMYLWPFRVPRRMTFDRIGINHLSGVSSTGVIRFALYASSAVGGTPSALITDFSGGTVDPTTAAAIKLLTISQTLDPDLYWAAVVAQFTGTAPSIAGAATPGSFVYPNSAGAGNVAPITAGVTGAPPNPAGVTNTSATAAVVYLRPA